MKMKNIRYALAIAILSASAASSAQFNNSGSASSSSEVKAWKGLRFSYDKPFLGGDMSDEYDGFSKNGFSAGYEQAFKVSKPLPMFVQTGLDFNFSRFSDSSEDEYGSYEDKVTALSLSLPVNFVYAVRINNLLTFKPYTGFYMRFNVSGKLKSEYADVDGGEKESEKLDLFDKDDMGDDKWKRFQAGWQIGAALDISKFSIGLGYALDFNKIAEKLNTSRLMVKVGCNF